MRRRSYAGAEIVVNLSASPFRLGVVETRREMIATRAADCQATVAYVNPVGANDGLVFDGGGFVAQNGRLLLASPRFREGVEAVTLDLDRTRRLRTENTTWREDQEAFAALAPKVSRVRVDAPTRGRDALVFPAPANKNFFLPAAGATPRAHATRSAKSCSMPSRSASATTSRRPGPSRPSGSRSRAGATASSSSPSRVAGSTSAGPIARKRSAARRPGRSCARSTCRPATRRRETRAAAEQVARDLDAPFAVVSIEDAFERELLAVEKMLQPGEALTALARQNVQARVRAERMWTWANAAQGLFLQTSNMSEKAVGYVTIGGDGEGALSVIANVPKTVVNYVLDWLYETTRWEGIRLTLLKPATAELADNQEDERELMPFPVLDACFALFAGEKMSPDEVAAGPQGRIPRARSRAARRLGRAVRQALLRVDLQVGPGADLDSRGQPRSRARARAPAPRRPARRVALTRERRQAAKPPREGKPQRTRRTQRDGAETLVRAT